MNVTEQTKYQEIWDIVYLRQHLSSLPEPGIGGQIKNPVLEEAKEILNQEILKLIKANFPTI